MSQMNHFNTSASGIFDEHIEPCLIIIKDITNLTTQLYDALAAANEQEMYEHLLAKLEIYLKHKQSSFSFWYCSLDVYYQSLIWNYFCKKNNIHNKIEDNSRILSTRFACFIELSTSKADFFKWIDNKSSNGDETDEKENIKDDNQCNVMGPASNVAKVSDFQCLTNLQHFNMLSRGQQSNIFDKFYHL